jgi:Asp-tRNA(Asn)/Glu-tRNA(Gln) amidotransferase A subunit family amidase
MYLADVFAIPVKLGGFPAISIPTKATSTLAHGELPVGFQLMGKKWHEADLLGIGQFYERI